MKLTTWCPTTIFDTYYMANNQKTNGIVLIVDDTPGNLAVLSDMLSEAGYRVLVATDGESALEQISFLKPDIILLDVMMPGIDGFETCHRLKHDTATQNIPIIFMTGLSELDNLLRGFNEGAVDYIVKPIRPAEVLARIDAQLTQSKNLQRAENTLDQIAYAALAFDRNGIITWLTNTAVKILYNHYTEPDEIKVGDYLPLNILEQVVCLTDNFNSITDQTHNEISIAEHYLGKVILCYEATGEFMLLIQKNSSEWDMHSLKTAFGLTPRESEILMWISKGKTNNEIGIILNSSPRTINKHLEHVFEKLGVPTRTAAVAKVLNHNS
jgi:DNA-binding response OmpR family regulator/DNA-binding CsgD family transcriptional regulator